MRSDISPKYFKIKKGYEIPLKVIREAVTSVLNNFQDSQNLYSNIIKDGCAIGFFRYEVDEDINAHKVEDRMRMRIFPFSEDTLSDNFKDDDFIRTILSNICEKKKYSQFDHLEHFRKYHSSEDAENLFKITFDRDDVVEFCCERKFVKIEGEEIDWTKLKKDLKKTGSTYYKKYSKQLDHLLFSSEMKTAYILPIPILSSPSVLLFINEQAIIDSIGRNKVIIRKFIKQLIHKVSNALFFHMYNRLLIEFTEEEGSNLQLTKQPDKESLIEKFAESISAIILPVRYKIDDGEWISFFDWYASTSGSKLHKVEVNLSPNRIKSEIKTPFFHTITFELPNFKMPCDSKKEWQFRAEKKMNGDYVFDEYFEQEEKFKITLQNLYRMIFDYWRSIRESKDFIKNELQETNKKFSDLIDETKLKELVDIASELSIKIEALSKGEITKPNSFLPISDDWNEFRFTYKNKVNLKTLKGKPFYWLFDFLKSQTNNVVDLDSFIAYKNDSKPIKKTELQKKHIDELEIQFNDIKKIIQELEPELKSLYDKITRNDDTDIHVNEMYDDQEISYRQEKELNFDNLTDESDRIVLYTYISYFKKLVDLKFILSGFEKNVYLPKNTIDYKSIIQSLENGAYKDHYASVKSKIHDSISSNELEVPNKRDFKSEYTKRLGEAIGTVIESHPLKEDVKKVFFGSGLIIESLRNKNGYTITSRSIYNTKWDNFKNWTFEK